MALLSTITCMSHRDLMPSLLLVKPTYATIFLSSLKYAASIPNYIISDVTSTRKPNRMTLIVRSSEEASGVASTATATEESREEEGGGSSPMEVPKGPPSLISALNVEKALRGIAITDVDHYGRLGLRRGCSFDQVRVAYENKVKEISSQGLDNQEDIDKELELLKESYTILSSEEQRRLYDWSLARSEGPDRYMWPFEVDITQTPKGTPPPREPEDVGPTIAVGYFILGWLILAFVLSIALNR